MIYFFTNQTYLKSYTIATSSNEPTLKTGTQIVASSLYTPQSKDFVLFNYKDPQYGDGVYIYRLVAEANDTLWIKNGRVFVNEIDYDDDLVLQHRYLVDSNKFMTYQATHNTNYDVAYSEEPNSLFAFLTPEVSEKLEATRSINDNNSTDTLIQSLYGGSWNQDWFGPYIIPEDHIFVMGDNRNNARDSRFIGPIALDDIVAVKRTK